MGEEVKLTNPDLEQLQAELGHKERQIKRLSEENQKLAREKKDLTEAMDAILQSYSWRCTAVVRKLSKVLQMLWPLYRNNTVECDLHAGRNVRAKEDSFLLCGPSPVINLRPREGQLPTGWTLVSGVLDAHKGHLFFYLYSNRGDGFREQERSLLPFENDYDASFLVKLPKQVEALRIDPFESEGEFSLTELRFTEIGKVQVLVHMYNKHFRSLVRRPKLLIRKMRKAWSIFREGGFTALRIKLFSDELTNNYQEWVKKYDTLSDKDLAEIKDDIKSLSYQPLISVVMPTYNTPEVYLRAAIESVLGQLYENFELCIADDASSEPHVQKVIEEYANKDKRIKYVVRDSNGHISVASNSALELAQGDFVALLDHDDELSAHALYTVVKELNKNPKLDMLYSDEDKITGYGMRFNPYFKSDFNPALLLSQNYICHLSVYRTEIVRRVGAFRSEVKGAQDWDLALRVIDSIPEENIKHIPYVLYHWRVIEGSTAQSTAHKPYVLESQKKTVEEHLGRKGQSAAQVEILESIAHLRVKFPLPETLPLVSLIIPTRDKVELLKRCVDSILADTNYDNFEILLVDNGSKEKKTFKYFDQLAKCSNIKILRDDGPFNFSRLNNGAVEQAKGEIVGFLNNDLEVISAGWLGEMVSHVIRPEIGMVGARLLYPGGQVQHAGVILGIGGVAGHNHKGVQRENPGYFNRAILMQNFSAVTAACALVRKRVFEEAGGFDEGALSVAFNDVDLCLKVGKCGYRNLYTPYAEFYHYESASRGYEHTPEKFIRFENEIEAMKKRWAHLLERDPYYNPNLTLVREDFSFAFPPRIEKPWKKRS